MLPSTVFVVQGFTGQMLLVSLRSIFGPSSHSINYYRQVWGLLRMAFEPWYNYRRTCLQIFLGILRIYKKSAIENESQITLLKTSFDTKHCSIRCASESSKTWKLENLMTGLGVKWKVIIRDSRRGVKWCVVPHSSYLLSFEKHELGFWVVADYSVFSGTSAIIHRLYRS